MRSVLWVLGMIRLQLCRLGNRFSIFEPESCHLNPGLFVVARSHLGAKRGPYVMTWLCLKAILRKNKQLCGLVNRCFSSWPGELASDSYGT